ncbi:MAG: hypothetical protein JWN15_1423 [Firmicutes bacterium]|nr:hypothetical protein [Bacillota bacterium]
MVKIFALIPALFLLAATGTALAEGPQDTWKITAPADGASTKASEVTVTVDPGQMKIVPPGAVVAGQGHWHFMVDGREVGKGAANSFTYKGLTPVSTCWRWHCTRAITRPIRAIRAVR